MSSHYIQEYKNRNYSVISCRNGLVKSLDHILVKQNDFYFYNLEWLFSDLIIEIDIRLARYLKN